MCTNLMALNSTLGEDLLDNLILVAGAKLILELRLAGGVQDALLAVPIKKSSATYTLSLSRSSPSCAQGFRKLPLMSEGPPSLPRYNLQYHVPLYRQLEHQLRPWDERALSPAATK
jgi:hypothetical protein